MDEHNRGEYPPSCSVGATITNNGCTMFVTV